MVSLGERFLCKEADRLLQHQDHQTLLLSRREQELLRLIVDGKSNIEIANSMYLGYLGLLRGTVLMKTAI